MSLFILCAYMSQWFPNRNNNFSGFSNNKAPVSTKKRIHTSSTCSYNSFNCRFSLTFKTKYSMNIIFKKWRNFAGMLLTSLSVTSSVSKYEINYFKKIIFRLGYTIRRIRMVLCFRKSYSDKYSSHLKKVFYDRLEDVTS